MIAYRHLSSVDRLWRAAIATNVAGLRKSPFSTKDCFYSHYFGNTIRKMSRTNDGSKKVKKLKKVALVWRPISTQSTSTEAFCSMRSDDGSQVQATYHMSSTSVSQDFSLDTEPMSDAPGLPNLGPNASEISNQAENVEGTASISVAIETEENLGQNQNFGTDSLEIYKESSVQDVSLGENIDLASGVERHSVSIEVNAPLIRFVKGKCGFTQRCIEEETGVKLIFPSSKKENSIFIEGTSVESVAKASEKVKNIRDQAVNSRNLDYSHFISLPLAVYGELVEKLTNFQNSIVGDANPNQDGNVNNDSYEDSLDEEEDIELHSEGANIAVKLEVQNNEKHVKVELGTASVKSNYLKQQRSSSVSDLGIDRSIFIKPKTLHLTVLMLKLYDKERIASATKVLQKISSKVKDALDNRPISIRLKGLACMRGSPAKARVLYAPVEEIDGEGRLACACRVIIDAYLEAGLVHKEDARQTLKLHATVMNARHRKSKKGTKGFDSFDARGIIKRYGLEEWGEYLIQEAHLSQRFKYDEKGYYHCCASISFPENMQIE